jgi:glycerol-3-phosphate dehydrogenase
MNQAASHFDIVIVGGGINGTGIARDAALRGLKVLLLEKCDFGSGTSSWSTRLIHGGLRYLEHGEIGLVYESLHERRHLRRIAKHLVRPLRINIPFYRTSSRSPMLIRLGMIAYDLLSLRKSLPRHRILGRKALLALEPGLNPAGLRGGAQYYDAQVVFAERLVIENVLSAQKAGAELRSYCEVTGIDIQEGRASGVRFRDDREAQERVVTAGVIINAAGPWVDTVLGQASCSFPRLMGGTKGSHIIVGQFTGAPRDAFYVEAASDGRPVFIVPWNGQYLVGTTDLRFDKDPDDARISSEEVDYLINETNRVFPRARLGRADIHFAYSGVRPLPFQEKGPESAITRRHLILHHSREAKNLVSIIGGKLTTYRNLSEQAVKLVLRLLGKPVVESRTARTLLPGARRIAKARRFLEQHAGLSQAGVERLLAIYGGRSSELIAFARKHPGMCEALDRDRTILRAEVAFVLQTESARTLTDVVHRRMMLGLTRDHGERHYDEIAALAAAACGWDAAMKAAQLSALRSYNERLRVPG